MVFPGWGTWSDRKALPQLPSLQLQRDSLQGFSIPYGKPYAKPYFQFAANWASLLRGNNFSQCLLELDLLRSHMGQNPRNPNVPPGSPPPTLLRMSEEATPVPPGEGTVGGAGPPESGLPVQASCEPQADPVAVARLPDQALGVRLLDQAPDVGLPDQAPDAALHDQARLPDQEASLQLPDQAGRLSSRDRLLFAVRHGRIREAGLLVAGMLQEEGSAKGGQNLSEAEERQNSDVAQERQNLRDAAERRNFDAAEGWQNFADAEGWQNYADVAEEWQNSGEGETGRAACGLAFLVAEMGAKGWFTELSRYVDPH